MLLEEAGEARRAVAVYIAYNNYCWHHKTFGGRTPAMAAGVTGHRWTMAELFDRVMQSVE